MAAPGLRLFGVSPVLGATVPSDYIGPLHPGSFSTPSNKVLGAANRMVACRVIAPKAGFIRDLYIVVGVQSGNIDLGVYDTGDTTPTVRTLIQHSGSLACPAAFANAPAVVWDPGAGVIPCKAGQQFEFALSADNNTAQFLQGSAGTDIQLPASHWATPGGVLPKLAGLIASGSFPLPGTIAEASYLSGNQGSAILPFICGRVSPT